MNTVATICLNGVCGPGQHIKPALRPAAGVEAGHAMRIAELDTTSLARWREPRLPRRNWPAHQESDRLRCLPGPTNWVESYARTLFPAHGHCVTCHP